MAESGIYKLVNRNDGKIYVGQSVDLEKRKRTHFWLLRENKHFNPRLQRAWNRGDKFDFEIIEKCQVPELNDKEIYWIKVLEAMSKGYNLCEGGESTVGYHFTDEQKEKIAKGNRGKVISKETVQKRKDTLAEHMKDKEFAERLNDLRRRQAKERGFGGHNRGIPCPEEQKRIVSEKLKGRYISDEHKAKLKELYSGEKSITAKLKQSDVVEIRYRFLCGETQRSINKDYPQVTPQTINDIVRNRRWKSVPNTLKELEEMRWRQETSAQGR